MTRKLNGTASMFSSNLGLFDHPLFLCRRCALTQHWYRRTWIVCALCEHYPCDETISTDKKTLVAIHIPLSNNFSAFFLVRLCSCSRTVSSRSPPNGVLIFHLLQTWNKHILFISYPNKLTALQFFISTIFLYFMFFCSYFASSLFVIQHRSTHSMQQRKEGKKKQLEKRKEKELHRKNNVLHIALQFFRSISADPLLWFSFYFSYSSVPFSFESKIRALVFFCVIRNLFNSDIIFFRAVFFLFPFLSLVVFGKYIFILDLFYFISFYFQLWLEFEGIIRR